MELFPTLPFPTRYSPNTPVAQAKPVWCHYGPRNLSNLTVFEFRHPDKTVGLLFIAQPLNLLANASLLSGVVFCLDIPVSCNLASDGPTPLEEAFYR